MRSVKIAIALGLALLTIAIGLTLTRSPPLLAGTNSIPANPGIAYASGGSKACQMSGTLPRGMSAIRISASTNTGPRVTLKVLSGPLLITHGEREAGWGVDETVTVPVQRVPRTIANANICMAFGPAIEPIQINGELVRTITVRDGTTRRFVRFRFEYLRPGHASWWSLVSSVARRMGFGHAPSGTWVVFLLIALMITFATLATRLVLRELR